MQVFCRIDYHLATHRLANGARSAAVYNDQRFSDHAPLAIEYEWKI
jgi:exodeoxyribonuclease-3